MAWEKIVSMKAGIVPFLVKDKEGTIDQKASVAKFEAALIQYAGKKEADASLVLSCINELFDQYKGASINQKGIISFVIQKMVVKNPELKNPSLFGMLSKRVEEVLKDNIGEGKSFATKLGPGGGTYRVADQKSE